MDAVWQCRSWQWVPNITPSARVCRRTSWLHVRDWPATSAVFGYGGSGVQLNVAPIVRARKPLSLSHTHTLCWFQQPKTSSGTSLLLLLLLLHLHQSSSSGITIELSHVI